MLTVSLLVVCGMMAWGQNTWPTDRNAQNYTIQIPNQDAISGNSTKVIYAQKGEQKTLKFQDGGGPENIDGFIRWYVEGNSNRKTGLEWGGDKNNQAREFSNCYAWLRNRNTDASPTSISQMHYTVPTDANVGDIYRVIFEGSASKILLRGATLSHLPIYPSERFTKSM